MALAHARSMECGSCLGPISLRCWNRRLPKRPMRRACPPNVKVLRSRSTSHESRIVIYPLMRRFRERFRPLRLFFRALPRLLDRRLPPVGTGQGLWHHCPFAFLRGGLRFNTEWPVSPAPLQCERLCASVFQCCADCSLGSSPSRWC